MRGEGRGGGGKGGGEGQREEGGIGPIPRGRHFVPVTPTMKRTQPVGRRWSYPILSPGRREICRKIRSYHATHALRLQWHVVSQDMSYAILLTGAMPRYVGGDDGW